MDDYGNYEEYGNFGDSGKSDGSGDSGASSDSDYSLASNDSGETSGSGEYVVDRPTQLICISDIYLLSWRWRPPWSLGTLYQWSLQPKKAS